MKSGLGVEYGWNIIAFAKYSWVESLTLGIYRIMKCGPSPEFKIFMQL